jgi:hypothetical protein
MVISYTFLVLVQTVKINNFFERQKRTPKIYHYLGCMKPLIKHILPLS